MTTTALPYQRIILKLSGESFAPAGRARHQHAGGGGHRRRRPIGPRNSASQIAIVIGGGNILRGAQFTAGNSSIQEATAHYMGMLATVINGLALQDALESLGCETRLMSAIGWTAWPSRTSAAAPGGTWKRAAS